MRKLKVSKIWFSAFLLAVFAIGCSDPDKNAGAGNPGDPLTPPTVSAVTPPDGSLGACLNTALITATFSKPMNPATIISPATSFTLAGPGGANASGTVSLDSTGQVATFTPTSVLTGGAAYIATVSTGAHDTFGNALAAKKTWTFTTGASACPGPVAFGSPGCGFGILAGSTVTNVAGTATTVSGDVGVWAGTAITGFGAPASITGTFYPGTATAQTAQGQLTAAFNSAKSSSAGGVILLADIGGQTLAPGAYRTTSAQPTLAITGTLTLDGQGNPNAVFIFHVESSMTTAAGSPSVPASVVKLIGGAQSKNVFWQIEASATLGTYSTFTGTIMANQSITLGTGATLNGRALAQIAAVSLDTNKVVVPPC